MVNDEHSTTLVMLKYMSRVWVRERNPTRNYLCGGLNILNWIFPNMKLESANKIREGNTMTDLYSDWAEIGKSNVWTTFGQLEFDWPKLTGILFPYPVPTVAIFDGLLQCFKRWNYEHIYLQVALLDDERKEKYWSIVSSSSAYGLSS